jgi:hypothetical protein
MRSETSFHTFRHTFPDALREADISEERVRRIGGWGRPAPIRFTEEAFVLDFRARNEEDHDPGLDLRQL